MTTTTLISRRTIARLLDWYARFGVANFGSTLGYLLLMTLISALIAGLAIIIRQTLATGSADIDLLSILSQEGFRNLVAALLVLGIGISRKTGEQQEEPTGREKRKGNNGIIALFVFVILLFHTLLYTNPFAPDPKGLGGLFDTFAFGSDPGLDYMIVEFVKNLLLPIFLALLLQLRDIHGTYNRGIRKYRGAYLVSGAFLFILYAVFISLLDLCDQMIILFLNDPLPSSPSEGLLSLFLQTGIFLLLLSLFYPAFRISLEYPFLVVNELLSINEQVSGENFPEESPPFPGS